MTSTTRSGAPGQYPSTSACRAKRSRETKATSGARTVSGVVAKRKPVSAAYTTPSRWARTDPLSDVKRFIAIRPCLCPAGAIRVTSPLTSS